MPEFVEHRNGVRIESEIPFKVTEWQDLKYLHIFWSYYQWTKMIVRAYGYDFKWTRKSPYRKHDNRDKQGFYRGDPGKYPIHS